MDGGDTVAPTFVPVKTIINQYGESVSVDATGRDSSGNLVIAKESPADDAAREAANLAMGLTKIGNVPEKEKGFSLSDVEEMINAALEKDRAARAEDIAAAKRENVTTALEDFRSMLAGSGLESLADTLDSLIKQDKTSAQIKLEIRKSDAYEKRFPGMKALSAKNRAISEGDYISLERGYEQILRSYGLDTSTYGERSDLGNYIANEVSAKEFEDRVSLAKTRIEQQPEVTQALADIYGINKSDAVGYLLNPEKAMDVINKQVRASEIGAAALAAKFTLGDIASAKAAQAEAFIGAAGTSDFTSLKQTFGRARTLADTQKRLAYLERTGYNEIEAVQAELEGSQPAVLASQKRAAREAARFGGSAGVSTYSLRSEAGI